MDDDEASWRWIRGGPGEMGLKSNLKGECGQYIYIYWNHACKGSIAFPLWMVRLWPYMLVEHPYDNELYSWETCTKYWNMYIRIIYIYILYIYIYS